MTLIGLALIEATQVSNHIPIVFSFSCTTVILKTEKTLGMKFSSKRDLFDVSFVLIRL